MEIGRKIAEARRAKNLTQEQLAEMMKVTRQTVSRWESQAAYPEMEKIITLASILEVSCDYLLNDKIEKMTDSQKQIPRKQTEKNSVTRLLQKAKGRTIKIEFFSDAQDYDICGKKAVITDFDGSWAQIMYKNGKTTGKKLIPISSILSIKFEKEEETWSL